MGFGERLRLARKNARMTGEELGKALADATRRETAFSKQTITNWEKNRNFPNPSQIEALCKLLGVSADHLICGAGSNLSVKALQLALIYDRMPAPKQVRLMRLAEIAFDARPGEFGDEGWTEEATGGVSQEEPRFLK
jgi:transcriptional regulator with XRE-family HTH domain